MVPNATIMVCVFLGRVIMYNCIAATHHLGARLLLHPKHHSAEEEEEHSDDQSIIA
jgi:hypothetical protein